MRNKALIVDDDPMAVDLLSFALKEEGYSVIPCTDSHSALAAFGKETIDVALIDLVLPEIPGMELIRKGRKLQQDCKFIVISGRLNVQDFISLQTMGVYDSFYKPANTQTILKAVAKAIETGKSEKTLGSRNTVHDAEQVK